MEDKHSNADSKQLRHAYYAVSFLDLLGQQDAFLSTDFIPNRADSAAVDALHAKVRENVQTIDLLHSISARFASSDPYQYILRQDSPLLKLPVEAQLLARKWKSSEIKHLGWSDGVVFYSSLVETENHFPVTAMFNLVASAGVIMLQLLSIKKPIRGGIDVGTAVESRNQIFGAAVVKAYQLESKHAGHPRILVGNTFGEFLARLPDANPIDPSSQFRKSESLRIEKMITQDEDGLWMVDYLGDEFRDLFEGVSAQETFEQALRFVSESKEKWTTSQNTKLAGRYSALQRYFEKNANRWTSS